MQFVNVWKVVRQRKRIFGLLHVPVFSKQPKLKAVKVKADTIKLIKPANETNQTTNKTNKPKADYITHLPNPA